MEKCLPFEIAQNGYFPADMLSLSILNTYSDTDALLYGFYNMFGNFCYHRNGDITLNAELNWECPLLSRKFVPRTILTDIKSFSLIKFIESCINNKYYLYITLDQSKLKYYKYFEGPFRPHPITFYGYNCEIEKFYIADFTDGKKYRKETIAYDEFIAANESVQKNMGVLDVFSGTNEWILDIELVKYLHNYDMIYNLDYIKYSIYMFLQGRGINGNISSLHRRLQPQVGLNSYGIAEYYEAKISDEFYGISVLKNVVSHIENCINYSEYKFNFRHIYLILQYTKLMKIKFGKLYQAGNIEETLYFNEILTKINMVEKDMSLALNLSLRYIYANNLGDLKKIADYTKTGVENIDVINSTVLKVLSEAE